MNLSILIPCYNWDIYNLVKELHELCFTEKQLNNFEIICIEDGSSQLFSNKQITQLQCVEYTKLPHNIGRSAIRNLLANKAQYEWLLFIDADSKIKTQNFIKNYIEKTTKKHIIKNIYYGGTTYENNQFSKNQKLHYKYGKEIESNRKKNVFSSHHFLIHKTNFEKMKFDEKIKSYGYEDILFQIKSNRNFIYIDNPLYHTGIKTTTNFINDCESGLQNLIEYSYDKECVRNIKLLRLWNIVSIMKLSKMVLWIFEYLNPQIIRNLHSSNPRLILFQFYKLGFFIKLKHMLGKKTK